MMIIMPGTEVIEIEEIQRKADEIGKTNVMFNGYQAAITLSKQFVEVGLTPAVIYDQYQQKLLVTSQEHLDGKLN